MERVAVRTPKMAQASTSKLLLCSRAKLSRLVSSDRFIPSSNRCSLPSWRRSSEASQPRYQISVVLFDCFSCILALRPTKIGDRSDAKNLMYPDARAG